MALKTVIFTCLLVTCFALLPRIVSSQRSLGRNFDRLEDLPTEIVSEPRKRPFCNAFTGCGRKRSSPPLEQKIRKLPMDDSVESFLDMSAEPVGDDISRQIMSEAKLWEAIQEAGAKLMRRRQLSKSLPYPLPMNSMNMQ